MEDKSQSRGTPAYAPHKTFIKLINSLKESGAPSQIDRSVLKSMSGSDQSAIIGSLKYLRLISDAGVPSPKLTQLIDAEEENRKTLMRDVLKDSYEFLFAGSIDLTRATTKQVEDAFRSQGVSGSTIVKCIAFFLAAAKDAGIVVSSHVKTPAPVRSNPPKPRNGGTPATTEREVLPPREEAPPPDMKQIKIQLMDKPDVVITVPASFDETDWAFLEPILKAYMGRMFKGGAK